MYNITFSHWFDLMLADFCAVIKKKAFVFIWSFEY